MFCKFLKFVALLTIMFSGLSLSWAESNEVMPKLHLVVGESRVQYEDEEYPRGGFPVELIEILLKEEDVDYSITLLPWARVVDYMRKGKIDGVIGLYLNEERENYLLFTDPILRAKQSLFKLKARTDIIYDDNVENLSKLRVGVVRGHTLPDVLMTSKVQKLQEVANSELNIKMLIKNRIDVLLEAEGVLNFMVKNHLSDYQGMFEPLEPALFERDIYFAFKKGDSYIEDVHSRVNKKIREYKASGKLQALQEKYGFYNAQ